MNYILNKDFYTTEELAILLQVHTETIRRRIKGGYIKAGKTVPTDKGHYRIYRDQVAEYLRSTGASVEANQGTDVD